MQVFRALNHETHEEHEKKQIFVLFVCFVVRFLSIYFRPGIFSELPVAITKSFDSSRVYCFFWKSTIDFL